VSDLLSVVNKWWVVLLVNWQSRLVYLTNVTTHCVIDSYIIPVLVIWLHMSQEKLKSVFKCISFISTLKIWRRRRKFHWFNMSYRHKFLVHIVTRAYYVQSIQASFIFSCFHFSISFRVFWLFLFSKYKSTVFWKSVEGL
jgi:hypothetical protein